MGRQRYLDDQPAEYEFEEAASEMLSATAMSAI